MVSLSLGSLYAVSACRGNKQFLQRFRCQDRPAFVRSCRHICMCDVGRNHLSHNTGLMSDCLSSQKGYMNEDRRQCICDSGHEFDKDVQRNPYHIFSGVADRISGDGCLVRR